MKERGGKREGAGRPRVKPEVPQAPSKGVASRVLDSIDEVAYWHKMLRTDVPLKDFDTKLSLAERREVRETLEYVTNRRDGKPAQGVFVGDTRETARELDFGDLPQLIAPSKPDKAGKPN